MINNHSTPGKPRIPVAVKKASLQQATPGAMPMDAGQVPMSNSGTTTGGQYNQPPSRPQNGPEGRPRPSRPINGPIGRPTQAPVGMQPEMQRVSPGVYRPVQGPAQTQMHPALQQMQPYSKVSTGGMSMGPHAVSQLQAANQHTLPGRLPNGMDAAKDAIAQFGLGGQSGMPNQPLNNSYNPKWSSVGDNLAQITNRLRMNNFGFGEPMAGAVRPQYF